MTNTRVSWALRTSLVILLLFWPLPLTHTERARHPHCRACIGGDQRQKKKEKEARMTNTRVSWALRTSLAILLLFWPLPLTHTERARHPHCRASICEDERQNKKETH